MTALSDSVPPPMRSPWSFMGSICLHGWVLAWVALGTSLPLERRKSLYEREIQPSEKRIVWYKLSDRLPDVTPPEAKRDARPLRARKMFDQNLAAGPRDDARPPQLIWAPAPEITPAKPLPLPNIVAIAPPPRPPARLFVPPPVKAHAPDPAPSLPAAPKLAVTPELKPLVLDLSAPRPIRRFTPPAAPKLPLPADPAPLPAAPELAPAVSALTAGVPLPRQQRQFVAPPKQAAAPADPATIAAPPPALTAAAAVPSENSLVIAGLNPVRSVEVPAPPGSVKGGFSGGPKPQPKGGEGTPSGALLEIPSLTIQGGAKNPQPPVMVARVSPTSPEALAAALHSARGGAPAAGGAHQAVRVSSAPDPRMYGRQVYTMALQVPNLTSYSGSWLVWFASREPDIGNASVDMRPPLPLHMVSPKYIHSAVEERVEGKVRLWAVIGKDGRVADISLLQHLDARLDSSAEEALGKWQFQPALRNGIAVDVDAVFEIPFNLAPKTDR
jgi:TonB family protein